MMAEDDEKFPSKKTSQTSVDAFINKIAATPVNNAVGTPGRLLFAMDATASRQPAWDTAARIQGEMFRETAALGGLDIQLAFYRGFGEFKVSQWTDSESELLGLMTSVACRAGETQIGKVLSHALNETSKQKVNALVFVGDSVEEDIDELGHKAGKLGLVGAPAFMFHEGDNPLAQFAFREVARLSNGAYCQFNYNAAQVLRELLGAVAVYAAGGRPALEDMAKKRGGEILRIVHQLKGE